MSERLQHVALIIFALAFLAILAMMNSNVLGISNTVNDQLSRTYASTEMHELRAFDDTKVTGATVISAIKNYDNLYTYDMKITVKTQKSTTTYGADGDRDAYMTTNPSASDYINPAKSFTATIDVNENDIVTGVTFEEVR